jgi:hypothetical protein
VPEVLQPGQVSRIQQDTGATVQRYQTPARSADASSFRSQLLQQFLRLLMMMMMMMMMMIMMIVMVALAPMIFLPSGTAAAGAVVSSFITNHRHGHQYDARSIFWMVGHNNNNNNHLFHTPTVTKLRSVSSSSESSSEGGAISATTDTPVATNTIKQMDDEYRTLLATTHHCGAILNEAVQPRVHNNTTTKDTAEQNEIILETLLQLEQCTRRINQYNDHAYAHDMLQRNLTGAWRLIATTGTASKSPLSKFWNNKDTTATDRPAKNNLQLNYFPLKAIQTFNTTTQCITNAIYIGESDYKALQFSGNFTFNVQKSRLEFDFLQLELFQWIQISLQGGQAAQIGATTGLGSSSNPRNFEQRKKLPFFLWISADANVATARGGGGGLALWKRVG